MGAPGLAHGILTTSASADFLYKCTDVYSPAHERTLAWDDPAVGIEWPLPSSELIVSERDSLAPHLADIAHELPFVYSA